MSYYKRKWQIVFAIISMAIFGLSSCTKKFEEINTPWDGPPVNSVPQFYVAFVSNLLIADASVSYSSWTYPITQQGAIYTKSDYVYGNDGNEDWSKFYHNLANYNAMLELIAKAPDTTIYTNVKAMMKVLRAYQAIKLSNFYGDMPYIRAGKGFNYATVNYVPVYDKQQSIYVSCLTDLKWAVDNFSATDPKQYALGSNELILLNNIPQWIEFANSFRLRLALTLYDKDQADAAPHITEALTKPLLDADGTNVGLYPGTHIPNMDLAARQYAFGTECRLRMGTTMWQQMSNNDNTDGSGIFDPRCTVYFEPNNASLWVPIPQNAAAAATAEGGDPYNYARDANWANKNGSNGTVNKYANYNYYWGRDINIPELFMTAAEVHFLKAEVFVRGLSGSADLTQAQTEYNAGITTSVNFWVGQAINSTVWVVNKPAGLPTATTMTALLTNPKVLFNATTALQQIYAQEWIDMFRQPWEAWTLLKRTGRATPTDATNSTNYVSTYGGLNRYQYPSSEKSYNFKNWQAETNGNDVVGTKIFIAK